MIRAVKDSVLHSRKWHVLNIATNATQNIRTVFYAPESTVNDGSDYVWTSEKIYFQHVLCVMRGISNDLRENEFKPFLVLVEIHWKSLSCFDDLFVSFFHLINSIYSKLVCSPSLFYQCMHEHLLYKKKTKTSKRQNYMTTAIITITYFTTTMSHRRMQFNILLANRCFMANGYGRLYGRCATANIRRRILYCVYHHVCKNSSKNLEISCKQANDEFVKLYV